MSKIQLNETEKALEAFLKGVIKQARKNLEAKGINASGRLSSRFRQSYKVGENSIEGTITGEDYAKFIDLGVKGVKSGKSLGGFKFKSKGGKRGLKGMPPPKAFDKWNIIRGRAGRDEKGKFLTRKQLNFKTAVGVFNYGIKPTKFFSSAFEDEFNKLPKELIEAYALDVETFMEFILNE
jgi:hypothetical protein